MQSPKPKAQEEGTELTESELESVSGGTVSEWFTPTHKPGPEGPYIHPLPPKLHVPITTQVTDEG